MSRETEYAARLLLDWLNERYHRAYALTDIQDDLLTASEADQKPLSIAVAQLFEVSPEEQQRREHLAGRLDDSRPGSYILWVPPGGELPGEEPDESEWVRRIVLAASRLASGRAGEAREPVKMALGKVRDEGGYASVVGGLGRHWTDISAKLNGSFYLDSRGLHRFTKNEDERKQLYEEIALLSQGLTTGEMAEFEHEDAWAVQRLARSEGLTDGWVVSGSPEGFDPADVGAIRRLLRPRLAAAAQRIGANRDAVRVLVLIGAYDYLEYENAGPALRGFDPSLTASFDVIALVGDAQVKPILLSRSLPFAAV